MGFGRPLSPSPPFLRTLPINFIAGHFKAEIIFLLFLVALYVGCFVCLFFLHIVYDAQAENTSKITNICLCFANDIVTVDAFVGLTVLLSILFCMFISKI